MLTQSWVFLDWTGSKDATAHGTLFVSSTLNLALGLFTRSLYALNDFAS